jgi:ribonuclease HI
MQTKNNNILKMEALGVTRAINIRLAEGYEKVFIATDAKYVWNLILNVEIFKMTNQNYKVDAETMEHIYLSRSILDEKGWGFRYIWHQTNTAADFLAKYAIIRKENGRLDPGYYEDLDTLYSKNRMPFGLKDILESEMGLIRMFGTSTVGPH